MSNLPPDKELPLTLRSDRRLSQNPDPAARPGVAAQARPDRVQAGDGTAPRTSGFDGLIDQATAIGLGMTGIALVTGFGWFIERRRRIASAATKAPVPAATAIPTVASTADDAASEVASDAARAVATVPDDIEVTAIDVDAPVTAAATDAEPQYQPAPVPTRRRSSWVVNVPRRQRLIAFLMGMRKVAGALAILGAIAVVVFWSIESTEPGPRDLGLTWNLLTVTFAGWAGHWGFGGLANWLHRATFNRVHPKFDT